MTKFIYIYSLLGWAELSGRTFDFNRLKSPMFFCCFGIKCLLKQYFSVVRGLFTHSDFQIPEETTYLLNTTQHNTPSSET